MEVGVEEEMELNNVGSDWTSGSPLDVNIALSQFITSSPLYGDDGMPEDIYDNINPQPIVHIPPTVEGLIYDETPTCLPYRDDIIKVDLSPDTIHNIMKVIKSYMVNIKQNEQNLNNDDLYDRQNVCRGIIEDLDGYLNKYVRNRPWHPMLKKWVASVGKEKVRKDVDTWSC